MSDLKFVIQVEGQEQIERVSKSTKRLETRIRELDKDLKSGRVSSDQFRKGLVEIRRSVDGQFSSWQKAKAEIDKYVRSLRAIDKQKAVENATREYKRLAASLDPLEAATQQYQRQVKILNNALDKGVINLQEYNNAVREVQSRMQAGGVIFNQFGQVANVNIRRFKRFGAVGLQQVGYQVGDFAVQLQGGTNAMVALGQQGSQLLGIMGPRGAIAGAVLAIGTAIAAPLWQARSAAQKATGAFDKFKSALDKSTTSSKELLDVMQKVDATVSEVTLARFNQSIKEAGENLTTTIEAALEAVDTQVWYERGFKTGIRAVLPSIWTPEFALSEADVLQNMGLDITVLESFFDRFQENIESLDWQRAEISVESLVGYLESMGIALEDADPALLQIILNMDEAAIRAKQLKREQEEQTRLLEMLRGKSSGYAEAIRELADKFGVAAVEAMKIREVDIASGITPAVEEAAKLAKNLGIALGNALAITQWEASRSVTQEDTLINMPVVSGDMGDRYGVDTLRGMGYTEEALKAMGLLKDKSGGSKKDPDPMGLMKSIMTPSEALQSEYEQRLEQLKQFNDQELALVGGHAEARRRIEEQYSKGIQDIQRQERSTRLTELSGMFGAMASIAETGGQNLLGIQAVVSGAATMIAAYETAQKAAAEATTIPGRIAAYAAFLAQGIATVQKITSIGNTGRASSGGGSSVSIPSGAAATIQQNQTAPQQPQRVLIEGLSTDSLISGQQLSDLFDRLYEENSERGAIFMVAR